MLDFFNENSEKLEQIEDECEVTGGRNQHVSYGDFESDGEIVNFSENWSKSPETKVFHSNFVMQQNGVMKNMNLYYLVGKTDHNGGEGKRETTFVVSAITENHFCDTLEDAQNDFETGVAEAKKIGIDGTFYLYEIPALIENEDDYLTYEDKNKHFLLCLENETAEEIEKEEII